MKTFAKEPAVGLENSVQLGTLTEVATWLPIDHHVEQSEEVEAIRDLSGQLDDGLECRLLEDLPASFG